VKSVPPFSQAAFTLLSGGSVTLGDHEWTKLLAFSDRMQMTLQLLAAREYLPDWVLHEILVRAEKNARRGELLSAAYAEISARLQSRSLEYVMLKGFTHATGFGVDASRRVQYDFDLLCEPGTAPAICDALACIGYHPHGRVSLSDQHLPPLVRQFDYEWSGDYFDPHIPISLDIHTSIWNNETDRLRLDRTADFWSRRTMSGSVPALCAPDRLAFASLHALRHILRNDARPAHVYELACALTYLRGDETFWAEWTRLYDEPLRRAQGVAFRFAASWFGCDIPAAAASVPPAVETWFENCAWSPIANLHEPNKDAVWLNVAMLSRFRDKITVLRRRLLPAKSVGATNRTSRIAYHARAIPGALASGARWVWRSTISSIASHTSR